MIIVNTVGRLGNQMFQYAFALNTAQKLNSRFIIDEQNYHFYLHKYFELPSFSYVQNKVERKVVKTLMKCKLLKLERVTIDNNTCPNSVCIKVMDQKYYEGFFQSDIFFKSNLEEVKKNFTIKRNYQKTFNKDYSYLLNTEKLVVLHVRRTDYITHNWALPMSYYRDCLNKLNINSNTKVVVISDEINSTKEYFNNDDFHYPNGDEITDFQILKNADIAIIANSSFAWWASYLNCKKNKQIYAPQYWLGFHEFEEYPKGIMTNRFNWNKIK